MNLDQSTYMHCELCPRACGVNRAAGELGVCGQDAQLRIARAALHFWEEPPISGEKGSGTIFFVGCPLRCVYCQNIEISRARVASRVKSRGHENNNQSEQYKGSATSKSIAAASKCVSDVPGRQVSTERLAQIMLELQSQGALNINLVTALHFAPQIKEAVACARKAGLSIPIVCNTSGYERAELIEDLADTVDIWLTDFKYASSELARKLSAAPDYPETAERALLAMKENLARTGGRVLDATGVMKRGLIVRHLVLPGHTDDSLVVLDRIWELCGNICDLSVMNQYTPNVAMCARNDELSRAVTDDEYESVLDYADNLGFVRLWWQEGGTVSESFIPAFDLTGV